MCCSQIWHILIIQYPLYPHPHSPNKSQPVELAFAFTHKEVCVHVYSFLLVHLCLWVTEPPSCSFPTLLSLKFIQTVSSAAGHWAALPEELGFSSCSFSIFFFLSDMVRLYSSLLKKSMCCVAQKLCLEFHCSDSLLSSFSFSVAAGKSSIKPFLWNTV